MIEIGLTGGIGAGKSTVAKEFAAQGMAVIDADAISRKLTAPGTRGQDAVARAFPEAVVDGVVDRGCLAEIVFSHREQRERLEQIIHPLVADESRRLGEGHEIVVHDVPLIAELGTANRYDVVVVVAASHDTRRQRLHARGMSDADISARMAAQATDDQRREIADYWIDNDGDPALLAGQVAAIVASVSGNR